MANAKEPKTERTVVKGVLVAMDLAQFLIQDRSAWFELTPLPDDEYEVRYKPENHAAVLQRLSSGSAGVAGCEACRGRGWILSFNMDRQVYEIQKCDTCDRFDSDREAGDVGARIIEAALAVTDLAVHNAVQNVRRRRG